jgi:hypothetical protein
MYPHQGAQSSGRQRCSATRPLIHRRHTPCMGAQRRERETLNQPTADRQTTKLKNIDKSN